MKKKNEILDRWNSETPPFWKRVQKMGVSVASAGGIILGVSEIPGIKLPGSLVMAGGIMIAVGSVMAAQSKLTKI